MVWYKNRFYRANQFAAAYGSARAVPCSLRGQGSVRLGGSDTRTGLPRPRGLRGAEAPADHWSSIYARRKPSHPLCTSAGSRCFSVISSGIRESSWLLYRDYPVRSQQEWNDSISGWTTSGRSGVDEIRGDNTATTVVGIIAKLTAGRKPWPFVVLFLQEVARLHTPSGSSGLL